MPQIDKFIFLDQIIFTLIVLVILYIVNVYIFFPKLIKVLRLRHQILLFLKKRKQSIVFLQDLFFILYGFFFSFIVLFLNTVCFYSSECKVKYSCFFKAISAFVFFEH